jgi:hypothetical protein
MANPPQMDRRPAQVPQPPKESAYEQLEERSDQLQREHEDGGHGASQPPDAKRPLLNPEYSE